MDVVMPMGLSVIFVAVVAVGRRNVVGMAVMPPVIRMRVFIATEIACATFQRIADFDIDGIRGVRDDEDGEKEGEQEAHAAQSIT